jgi:hypothetical protein
MDICFSYNSNKLYCVRFWDHFLFLCESRANKFSGKLNPALIQSMGLSRYFHEEITLHSLLTVQVGSRNRFEKRSINYIYKLIAYMNHNLIKINKCSVSTYQLSLSFNLMKYHFQTKLVIVKLICHLRPEF